MTHQNNADGNTHSHEKCRKLFEQLSELIDEELPKEERDRIKKHMAECNCCSACLESLKRTIDICKNIDIKPVPEEFSEKLRQIAKNAKLPAAKASE